MTIGSITTTGGISGGSLATTGALTAGSATLSGTLAADQLNVTGGVTASALTAATGNMATITSGTIANSGLLSSGTLQVTGISSTNGIVNNGELTSSGVTTLTGTTGINTTGTAATTIGNSNPATVVIMRGGAGSVAIGNETTAIVGATTSMTLNGSGVTFKNTANGGGAVKITGVADGVSGYDAANMRQLQGLEARLNSSLKAQEVTLSRGVAMAAGLAAIPQVDQNKSYALGIGTGLYNGEASLAIGASMRLAENAVVKAGLSFSPGGEAPMGNVGMGLSW